MRYLSILIILFLTCTGAFAQINTAAQPLQYPGATISTQTPYFIWCDIYNTAAKPFVVKLTLTDSRGQSNEFTLTPLTVDSIYCVATIPVVLTPDTYTYTIHLLSNNKPVNSRYYHHKRYPVKGSFTIDVSRHNAVDTLNANELVYYLSQSRSNMLHNGYNAMFFSASGIISTCAGVAVYYWTNFGIVTTIISAITITSGVIGISAGIYYGMQYYHNEATINKVVTHDTVPQPHLAPDAGKQ
ncbi:MAG TPA: hypothetical protein PLH80_01065 [Spirochaetota bacterium]|nr:hypothetical protein [Spirochaetota bacterium]HPD04329.1 hypothetical protein [Spirochaetota bacterium]HQG41321.1 hypothetical protein [Spirochaetota bacterium]HQI37142.1 hypothetical protein [Spirochaetota bacterium]HQK06365.1 hypothetical protein [Spirochaetota bacterium]